jgi:sugar lactone lactonase YvrE
MLGLHAGVQEDGAIYAVRNGMAWRLPAASGTPSALALDARGRVWATLLNGWGVARLNDCGKLAAALALTTLRPTGLI